MRSATLLALVLLVASSSSLTAQRRGGGSAGVTLTPLIDCTYLHEHTDADQYWLRALVLWRSASPPSSHAAVSADAERRALLRLRALRRAAEDSGLTSLAGMQAGVVRSAAYGRGWIYVEGQRFRLPLAESALVVLVDLPESPDSSASVLGTTYVPDTISAEFWSKSWRRGDTLLIYQAAPKRLSQLMLDHLRGNAVLRGFIR